MAKTRTRLYAFIHIANAGLASFPVAELTNIDVANVDAAAKAIAENADIALGAKVRMSENIIAKNGIEPLKRAIAACEKGGTGGRVMVHISGVETRALMSEILDTRNGTVHLQPVQTVTAGVPFGRPYNLPFSVR